MYQMTDLTRALSEREIKEMLRLYYEKGYTKKALAELAGVHRNTINNIFKRLEG